MTKVARKARGSGHLADAVLHAEGEPPDGEAAPDPLPQHPHALPPGQVVTGGRQVTGGDQVIPVEVDEDGHQCEGGGVGPRALHIHLAQVNVVVMEVMMELVMELVMVVVVMEAQAPCRHLALPPEDDEGVAGQVFGQQVRHADPQAGVPGGAGVVLVVWGRAGDVGDQGGTASVLLVGLRRGLLLGVSLLARPPALEGGGPPGVALQEAPALHHPRHLQQPHLALLPSYSYNHVRTFAL